MGELSNNGSDNVGYATSIARRTAQGDNGAFRGGATSGTSFADFDENYIAINNGAGVSSSSYIARAGDTLQGIAQGLWGDSNLWYKLELR